MALETASLVSRVVRMVSGSLETCSLRTTTASSRRPLPPALELLPLLFKLHWLGLVSDKCFLWQEHEQKKKTHTK